jgi:hypothetical protein
MDYFIVAKSRAGWGVALGGDLLQEFSEIAPALASAREHRDAVRAAGFEAEMVNLTESNSSVLA